RDRCRPPAPDRGRRRGPGDDPGHRRDPRQADPDEAVSADRYVERRLRTLEAVEAAELGGILVSPGPDLAYLTAYSPPPLERLTLLVLSAGADPTLVVPALERPLAESAAGAPGLTMLDWRDGRHDPYGMVAAMLVSGRYAVTDRTWASHLLSLERAAPGRSFVAAGEALPL